MRQFLKISFIILAIFFFTYEVSAQQITLEKIFNRQGVFYKAIQISNKDYVVVGNERVNSNDKILLMKLNQFGDTLWKRIIGPIASEVYEGRWIEQTKDNGFIIAGAGGGVNTDAYIVKTDSLGNVIWTQHYGGNNLDQAYCITQSNDGGYMVLIRTTSFSPTNDIMILKIDSIGKAIWQKIYNYAIGYQIVAIGNVDYAIIGDKGKANGDVDVYLLKISSNGDTMWTKTYGGERVDQGRSLSQTKDGGFILGGHSESFISKDIAESYIVKADSNGNIQWQRTYSNNIISQGFDGCKSITTINNGYAFAGTSDSAHVERNSAYIRKIDFCGNLINQNFFRPSVKSNSFYSIQRTIDSGFILAGYSDQEMYIVKTDSMGFTNTVGINPVNEYLPKNFELFQNYPNPFNPSTTISFSIPTGSFVKLKVFDITGREIKVLISEYKQSGTYEVMFDGGNLSSGVYYYKLEAGNYFEIKKMVLIK